MEYLTLRQLAGVIKLAVTRQTGEHWVVAEVAQVNVNLKSGHCYLELIEKEDGQTLARMKGTVWSSAFGRLSARFRVETGKELEAGMKILMLARPVFHELYGLSLNIRDIDPAYTLGEMALKRRQTIERLIKEGIIERNRELPLAPVLQRIAVISSSTAAGYGDFISRITGSGYGFSITLCEAYLQGELAERSILAALKHFKRNAGLYDVVVIIRGGGSQADLQCFDSYGLAREAALCPLPVLTGIGHERDETVTDRVAHMRLMTPTAVADFILSRSREFEEAVEGLASRLTRRLEGLISAGRSVLQTLDTLLLAALRGRLTAHGYDLSRLARDFQHSVAQALLGRRGRVERLGVSLLLQTRAYLSGKAEAIRDINTRVRLLDPRGVLKRGYSITLYRGRPVTEASALREGDIIDTRLYKGTVRSSVRKTKGDSNDGKQEENLLF
jgi:exodeoxyribonuclease VII large subunit